MNKKFFILFGIITLIFISFFFLNSKHEIVNYPPKNDIVVAFGDSLTQGIGATEGNDYVSLLSSKIGREIINKGVSGNTSEQGLARIDEVLRENPGTTLVLFGGNDYLRKVPKEQTFQNLRTIITKLQDSGSIVILLGIRGGLLTDQFESDFEDLAEETGSIYVSNVLQGIFGNAKLMSDAIHPNDAGYLIMTNKIYEKINTYLK
jgi:acyl-CoA thioesterase-1